MHPVKLAKMKSKDKCPECRGRGYHAFSGIGFFYSDPSNCVGCNGSGLFSIWQKRNPNI